MALDGTDAAGPDPHADPSAAFLDVILGILEGAEREDVGPGRIVRAYEVVAALEQRPPSGGPVEGVEIPSAPPSVDNSSRPASGVP